MHSIGEFLLPDPDIRDVCDRVVGMIDRVHVVPQLQMFRVAIGGQVGRVQFSRDDRAGGLIQVASHDPLPLLTLCHEIGHMLDRCAAPPYHQMSSRTDDRWSAWLNETRASREAVELLRIATEGRIGARERAAYNLRTEEVWARSYTQFIALRSGSVDLLDQLASFMFEATAINVDVPRQWTDASFEPILEKIDELFSDFGWLR